MAVAGETDRFELDVLGLHARLRQPLREAVIEDTVIPAFTVQEQHRNVLQVFQFARGLVLQIARDLARRRFVVERGLQLGRVRDRRIVRDRAVRHAPTEPAAICVRHLRVVDAFDRRRGRFDSDDRLDEIRTRVGNEPAERAALRMRQQDDRTADRIEQRDIRVTRERLLPRAGEELHLRLRKRVEDRIADAAGAGPLRVLLRLRKIAARRRRGERFLESRRGPDRQIRTFGRAVHTGHVLRSAARRIVLEVHHVAHVEEVVSPARTAIGRLQPVDAGLSRAVQEHDRVGRANLLRDKDFDVHRPAHRRFLLGAELADVLAARVEEALPRNIINSDRGDAKAGRPFRRGLSVGKRRGGENHKHERD